MYPCLVGLLIVYVSGWRACWLMAIITPPPPSSTPRWRFLVAVTSFSTSLGELTANPALSCVFGCMRPQPIAAVMGLFVPGFFGLDPTSVELVRQRRDVTVPADDSVYGNEAAQGGSRLRATGVPAHWYQAVALTAWLARVHPCCSAEFQIMVKTTMASPTTPMSPQSMSAFSSRRSSEANGTSVTRRESIVSPLGAAGAASSPGKAPEGRIMSLGAGSGKRRRVSDANAMTYQGDAPELASNPGGSDIVAILKNRSEAEEVGLGLLGIDEVSEPTSTRMAAVSAWGPERRGGVFTDTNHVHVRFVVAVGSLVGRRSATASAGAPQTSSRKTCTRTSSSRAGARCALAWQRPWR